MTFLAVLVLAWCALLGGFVLGTCWASRRPAPLPPDLRTPDYKLVFVPQRPGRRVTVQWYDHDAEEWVASGPSPLAWREQFSEADLRVLDEVLDAQRRTRKW